MLKPFLLKQSFKGGKLIGTIPHNELPVELREPVKNVNISTRIRGIYTFLGAAAAGPASVFALAIHTSTTHAPAPTLTELLVKTGVPIVAASTVAFALSSRFVVRGQSKALGESIRQSRYFSEDHAPHPDIMNFMRKGATHVVPDRKGNLHFIKAPPELANQTFKPLFRKTREPI